MASATLLKSSFLPNKPEWWGATTTRRPGTATTVAMVVRASAYADELVKTVVRTSSIVFLSRLADRDRITILYARTRRTSVIEFRFLPHAT
jgi:hypothetical protein